MAENYRTADFGGNTGPSAMPLMRAMFTSDLLTLGKDRSKYGATLVAPKSADWSALQNAIKETVVGKWGEKGIERFKAGLIKNPILDGDSKSGRNKQTGEFHAGIGPDAFFIRPSSNDPVRVWSAKMTPITSASGIPSGSWGYPILHCYSWNHPDSGDMVVIGISDFMVTKVAEGDEILGGGGRPDPTKFFEAIGGSEGSGTAGGSAASMFD